MPKRRILVTSALPYANGEIHLGHLLEYIQTDIWVRFQRLMGNECHYICADDAHGAAVMLKAQQMNISAEEYIDSVKEDHERDIRAFGIDFSNYYSTHSQENKILSESIYKKLQEKGSIFTRSIRQLYDQEKQMFLADRFVKGTCPYCKTPEQYGDSCEVCGSTYNAEQLLNPRSVLTGSIPQIKQSEHDFFDLPTYKNILQNWHKLETIQKAIYNKLQEWFIEGLQPWDITRDAPYFGFEIPQKPGKYFYVWLDAPIGYMASFQNYCNKNTQYVFDDFWQENTNTELYHFIGKDIVYFHTLFWPAILHGAGFRKPTGVFAHGFVSINGQKMSKSRGTFITAKRYLEYIEPEYLRYYFASRLQDGIDDIDLDLKDFVLKMNSDVGGKLVNIAARCAKFINNYYENTISDHFGEYQQIVDFVQQKAEDITRAYEARQYSSAIRMIMDIADKVNAIIDAKAPWKMIKENNKNLEVQQLCSAMLECYWYMVGMLRPIMPDLFAKSSDIFAKNIVNKLQNGLIPVSLKGAIIEQFSHLYHKLSIDTVNNILDEK